MSRARPFPRTPTTPWVLAFAREMEAKLDLNREKGDREGWSKEDAGWLMEKLMREVGELRDALGFGCAKCGRGEHRTASTSTIRGECADIANFAMMIADVAGKMRPEGAERPNAQ